MLSWRMSTVYRFLQKYRIVLREKDHLPAHVHLTGAGVDVMIALEPVQVLMGHAPKPVIAHALQWIADNQTHLLQEWKKWHP